jgi:RAB protein geranylgeranyltransferase component A
MDQGCGYSVINTARSALSTIINVDNLPIGKHSLVKRFVRGVYNIKPSLPRYTATWDDHSLLDELFYECKLLNTSQHIKPYLDKISNQ